MNVRSIRSLVVFVLVTFWPVGFYFIFIAPFFLFQRADSLIIVQAIIFIALPIAVMVVSHSLFLAQKGWKQRGWVIYGAWLAIEFLAAYVFSAAIGGVSMAVVEGVASAKRFLEYAVLAAVLVAVGHIVIVPWIFVVLFLLKNLNRRFQVWSDAAAS